MLAVLPVLLAVASDISENTSGAALLLTLARVFGRLPLLLKGDTCPRVVDALLRGVAYPGGLTLWVLASSTELALLFGLFSAIGLVCPGWSGFLCTFCILKGLLWLLGNPSQSIFLSYV